MFRANRRPEASAKGKLEAPPEVEFVVFGSRVSDACFTGG